MYSRKSPSKIEKDAGIGRKLLEVLGYVSQTAWRLADFR